MKAFKTSWKHGDDNIIWHKFMQFKRRIKELNKRLNMVFFTLKLPFSDKYIATRKKVGKNLFLINIDRDNLLP